jgi:uncharacterized protein
MLVIDVASLDEGTHTFEIEPAAADLGLDPERFTRVRVDVVMNHYNRRFLVDVATTASARLECDRTLVLFDKELKGAYRLLFVPEDELEHGGANADEVRAVDPADPRLDLTDVAHDTIMLSVPSRCIAPEAEEFDIPTRFADPSDEEDDIDPRWEALKALRAQDDDEK